MSFLLYLVVMIVSVTSVMMGLDWLSSPASVVVPAVHTASTVKPAAAKRVKAVKRTNPAAHTTVAQSAPKSTAPAGAATSTVGNALARAEVADSDPPDLATRSADAVTASIPGPQCDVSACETAYRSFRASDCSYQPFDGPRRFCAKGHPSPGASRVIRTSDMRPPSSSCNFQACASAYRSFDPGTCTYQPFGGPRRLCEK